MLVVDASVMVDYLLGDPAVADAVVARLAGDREGAAAPHLLDVEVAQALRQLVLRREVAPERAGQALEDLRLFPMVRLPHHPLLPRIWELRGRLTAYDATYVALSEALGAVLLTRDRRLARGLDAGARVDVI